MYKYDQNFDNTGLYLNLSPYFKKVDDSSSDNVWREKNNQNNNNFTNNIVQIGSDTQRINSEIGYGFGIFNGVGNIKPFSGANWLGSSESQYKIGSRINFGTSINLNVVGHHNVKANRDAEQLFTFGGALKW